MQNTDFLRVTSANEVLDTQRSPVDRETIDAARDLIDSVRDNGEEALRQLATEYDGLSGDDTLFYTPEDMSAAYGRLPPVQRDPLESTAKQIREFAEAQKDCLSELETTVPGGSAGHRIQPVESAGAYAPGGNYPLPSTVLMTVVTARVAGVDNVWCASPDPGDITLAAAHVAEADGLVGAGGAHAIGSLAYGTETIPRSDIIVGPGSKWVTAGKKVVAGDCAIEFLAGPTELVILADETADPETTATDLLAQAEHAADALPVLVAPPDVIRAVDREIGPQLNDLPTKEVAEKGIQNGFAVAVDRMEDGVEVCNKLAPEHLHVVVEDPDAVRDELKHFGALFIGSASAEVFGDYGAGPNHTLPTGGSARFTGGLSVLHFLRVQTWLEMSGSIDALDLSRNVPMLARMEGLEGHARSAEKRSDS
jgi:phosphoribosyl-ATP pyrophosphohydrolase/phosphoribosyl-AMP cyclohydrolase/histidinol dehydrogenase